jgi:hypothetical protein
MKKCFGAHPLDDDEKHVLKTAPKVCPHVVSGVLCPLRRGY